MLQTPLSTTLTLTAGLLIGFSSLTATPLLAEEADDLFSEWDQTSDSSTTEKDTKQGHKKHNGHHFDPEKIAAHIKENNPDLFAKLDSNSDGTLDKEELKAGKKLLKKGKLSDEQKEKILAKLNGLKDSDPEKFAKIDHNGDGTIDEKEARHAHSQHMKHKAMKEKFDTNGDGTIDDDEKQAAKEAHKQHKRAELKKRADTNGDGVVDDEEKAAIKEKMKERADTNGDGTVDDEERKAARKQHKKECKEKRKERADKNNDGKVGPKERKNAKEKRSNRKK